MPVRSFIVTALLLLALPLSFTSAEEFIGEESDIGIESPASTEDEYAGGAYDSDNDGMRDKISSKVENDEFFF